MIPKIIHQIWIGQEIPSIIRYYTSTFKKLENEGFKYKLWGNEDINNKNFPITYKIINNFLKQKNPIYAKISDLMRYEILYHNGGIYVDSTMEYLQNIDKIPLDKYKFILSNERYCGLDCKGKYDKKYVSNSFIASVPKHIVLERLLSEKNLVNILANYKDYSTNILTGPYFLRTGIVDVNEVKMLDTDLIYPFNYEDDKNFDKCLSYEERTGFEKEYYFDNVFYIKKPCNEYENAVMIKHWDVGGTWIKRDDNKMKEELENIINKTSDKPTIINGKSNFVVVTYWWGRGNYNRNISKPCSDYYDKILNRMITSILQTVEEMKKYVKKISLENINTDNSFFLQSVFNSHKEYRNILCEYLNIDFKSSEEDINNKLKENKINFKYDSFLIKNFLKLSHEEMININFKIIEEIFYEKDKEKVKELIKVIKTTFKAPIMNHKFFKIYQGKSILEILIDNLSFIKPITYDAMIEKWKKRCEESDVNYLAVEYPDFAKKGGYQLAINAKPFFIRKALELCKDKNVVYIDGDMTVNRYPDIFDMENIDFMARGWNIDPRSSYKFQDSIMYDPYSFETSGGIMYFSQSKYSKLLLKFWIEETIKPINIGKADDRILSLIFNTKRCLCSMNIIQLPIEYLWLSQDYNERMLELFYDYDKKEMKDYIYVEHPECLTDEDTAHSLGASNIREPKYYKIISEVPSAVSEEMHEYIYFTKEDDKKVMSAYLNYLYKAVYFDITDSDLIEKSFVDIEDSDNNEPLLNITKFKDRYGKRNYIADNNLKKVVEIDLSEYEEKDDMIIVDKKICDDEIIPIILKALSNKKNILYIPQKANKDNIEEIKSTTYNDLELVFIPELPNKYLFNEFYKPKINLQQPILVRHSDILYKFLCMFNGLKDLSEYIHQGCYEIYSRVRIGYVFPRKIKDGNKEKMIDEDIKNYLSFIKENEIDGRRKKIKIILKRKKKIFLKRF